ncbi:MAG: HNH endonuclease signature motif containing protein [Anaerolineae bacterium]
MSISQALKTRLRLQAGDRCGYCLSPQLYVLVPLEIDHLKPQSDGGTDDEENLWLACRLCNNAKSTQTIAKDPETGETVQLYNPRYQDWQTHFAWSEDGTMIIGLTPIGRATVLALPLNNIFAVLVRKEWVSVGWHPPLD